MTKSCAKPVDKCLQVIKNVLTEHSGLIHVLALPVHLHFTIRNAKTNQCIAMVLFCCLCYE